MYNFWQSPMLSPVTDLFFASRSQRRKKSQVSCLGHLLIPSPLHEIALLGCTPLLAWGGCSWTHTHGSVLGGQREAWEESESFSGEGCMWGRFGHLFLRKDHHWGGKEGCRWISATESHGWTHFHDNNSWWFNIIFSFYVSSGLFL